MNEHYGQFSGPFTAKQNLLEKIQTSFPNAHITKIGIQAKENHKFFLNEEEFEMGRNEMLEFDDVDIFSFYFKEDEDEKTIIDFIIKDKTAQ